MTLHDIATQIHHISAGRVNGERFSRHELEATLGRWLREPQSRYILEAELPDGRWLVKAENLGRGMFDYYIPDTREQEAALKAELFG